MLSSELQRPGKRPFPYKVAFLCWLCFSGFACLTVALYLGALLWSWPLPFFYGYHGGELVIISVFSLLSPSKIRKQLAACALLGMVVGYCGEVWVMRQLFGALFDAATDGLALLGGGR